VSGKHVASMLKWCIVLVDSNLGEILK